VVNLVGSIKIFTLTITDTINDFFEPYITKIIDTFTGLDIWLQAIVLLIIGIFLIVGLFVFMKKFIKAFIVLAVLAAIFWFVYSQGYLESILAIDIFNYINV